MSKEKEDKEREEIYTKRFHRVCSYCICCCFLLLFSLLLSFFVVVFLVVLIVVVLKEEKEGYVIYTKRFHGVCSFLGRWCGDGMSTESTEVVDGLVLHFLCDG